MTRSSARPKLASAARDATLASTARDATLASTACDATLASAALDAAFASTPPDAPLASPAPRSDRGAGRRRATAVATALSVAAVAALGAPPADASSKAKPRCPKAGVTLARSAAPQVRVYRVGDALRACVRPAGTRRVLRDLGTWTPSTKVSLWDTTVAWTTERPGPSGPVDSVSALRITTGKAWLRTKHAVVAQGAATPASDDRVLGLQTTQAGAIWMTAGGAISAAVKRYDEEVTGYGPSAGPGAYPLQRTGRRFGLGVAGPAAAPAVAKGLNSYEADEADECGGTNFYSWVVPAFGSRSEARFSYFQEPVRAAPGC